VDCSGSPAASPARLLRDHPRAECADDLDRGAGGDLMVVQEENLGRMGEQRLEEPADLVIEIVSAGDLRFEEREKLPRYRQARIPEIWLIDPYAESIRVETLTTRGYQTTTLRDGSLASTIVPGFWIEVGWLWREPLPSSFACLREILG
jgi:Uma2 family endonuclease